MYVGEMLRRVKHLTKAPILGWRVVSASCMIDPVILKTVSFIEKESTCADKKEDFLLEEKLKILRSVLGSCKKEGRTQHIFYCPYCSLEHKKPKLSINIQGNLYKCWICNVAGRDIGKIVKDYGTQEQYKEWLQISGKVDFCDLKSYFKTFNSTEEEKKKLELPEGFNTLVSSDLSFVGGIARNYLLNRGLSQGDINLYKIGYCAEGRYFNRVIIPSFDEKGELNYYVARAYDGHHIKYINPKKDKTHIIYNDLLVDWSEPVVVVEGVFDAIRAGTQAIPILGSAVGAESMLFQKIVKHNSVVYLGLDYDAKEKELYIASRLLEYGVKVYKIPTSPEKDIGAMTPAEYKNQFDRSYEITEDTMISQKLGFV